MGRGGRRPGAGRKKKSTHLRGIDGGASARATVPAPTAAIEEFDAPDTLTMEERHVWLRQAPFAFANRTLTKATALSFERYCGLVVLEAGMRSRILAAGGADHRGIVQRINTFELQFCLTPCGKALYEPKPVDVPVNPLNRFRNHA